MKLSSEQPPPMRSLNQRNVRHGTADAKSSTDTSLQARSSTTARPSGRTLTDAANPPTAHPQPHINFLCSQGASAANAGGMVTVPVTRIGDTPTCESHGGGINAAAVQFSLRLCSEF